MDLSEVSLYENSRLYDIIHAGTLEQVKRTVTRENSNNDLFLSHAFMRDADVVNTVTYLLSIGVPITFNDVIRSMKYKETFELVLKRGLDIHFQIANGNNFLGGAINFYIFNNFKHNDVIYCIEHLILNNVSLNDEDPTYMSIYHKLKLNLEQKRANCKRATIALFLVLSKYKLPKDVARLIARDYVYSTRREQLWLAFY